MNLAKTLLAAAAALGALATIGAAKADPVKLRIAWIVPAGDAPLALLGRPGIAQHQDKSYALEFSHFTSTPAMITAIASGQVDLVPFAYSSFALAVENAKLNDLRIIADCFRDGVSGYYSTEFMVLNDSPIKKVEDLKGKVLTSNAAGSAVDIALREMLKKHGLQDKKDYSLIESAFPNMKAELLDHKVDLITGVTPFSQDPQLSDLDLLSPTGKLVVLASFAGRKAAGVLPPLTRFADSLWVQARSPSGNLAEQNS